MDEKKIIIYQIFTRLFGNKNRSCIENGTIEQNGCGKMNDITDNVLEQIKSLGVSHIWFTGIIRHATTTNYSAYNIPRQHPAVVKGKAGSPYAITDYYDVDPDLAVNVDDRMDEYEALVQRTHKHALKVIMDFVPNHVARQYQSVCRPAGVKDLGEDDDTSMAFSPNNNFYYCPGQHFLPGIDLKKGEECAYYEFPAKATGNDRFDNHPGINDWYETVKLNYGVDYCAFGGRKEYFSPVPDTWQKMTNILLFWASKGIDGFRCDMVEMVPTAFWSYAIPIVKNRYPQIIFIGEVYNPDLYRNYIAAGFDYLYDKVGMYDCLRSIVSGNGSATSITYQWQSVSDINSHMLFFLENHDEQRIASTFFCGEARKAIPALVVEAFMRTNPIMIYAGQEFGERGMDKEGFSGCDGRTTIFDYWCVDALYKGYFDTTALDESQQLLYSQYKKILDLASSEKAVAKGDFFDLMYVNPASTVFNPKDEFAFLRKYKNEVLFVVANFSAKAAHSEVTVPAHAFDYMKLPETTVRAVDLLTDTTVEITLKRDGAVVFELPPYGACIYKLNIDMDNEVYTLNAHNKEEFPPAHTAEHLLNQLMGRMFGCNRSTNAHIERKKSKMTFILDRKPSAKEEKEIESKMNELIAEDMPVTYEYVDRNHVPADVHLDRLPDDASQTIRLVRIGNYDVCPCIGKHVRSTSQIGRFVLLGTNWDQMKHAFRIRFKIIQ